jgi:2-desacetyl-2-hydroxyethyl bacteriochlorophyllide A dehydrogenase
VRFRGPGDVGLEESAEPEVGPLDVRIRPAAVGICGTDARIIEGAVPAVRGVVLGHEIAGHVTAVGDGVAGMREGDLVSVEPHLYCGRCRYCRLGHEHLCPEKRAFGVHLDGGMADSVVVPGRIAYRVPDDVDPRIACLAEPVACAVHGIDRLQPASGLPLLVLGAGPAGLMLTSLARLAGSTPIVVAEPDADRRRVALELGAHVTVDPGQADWLEQALAATGGDGFDFAIEASGSPAALEAAVTVSARRGRILVYGVARPGEMAAIPPQQVYAKELTILGSALNPYTHLRAIGLLRDLRLDRLSIGVFALERFAEAFEAQRDRASSKIVLAP